MRHTFHIPVLGTAYSIDTPLRVAHLGISSVISIVDDILIERMRKFHLQTAKLKYDPIPDSEEGFRSRRITAYLNTLQHLVEEKYRSLKDECFEKKGELVRYFELLPEQSSLKQLYRRFTAEKDPVTKQALEQEIRLYVKPGSIDVNIMAKVDKTNYNKDGEAVNSDALESLKGFAESNLNASVILSAGMNPRLYGYIENFTDFYPDENQQLRKRIILKVSDYRSAIIQAKYLAKKGLWVTEFRIESGLNCGGHAFATEGVLAGPILEEFKANRHTMIAELYDLYQRALTAKGYVSTVVPVQKISYQGGIGTVQEDMFLRDHYELDGTGWGSPFLLVPEVTTVEQQTLESLTKSTSNDFYISGASPLGVPFNSFRLSTSEKLRLDRLEKGRPGSPCLQKFLVSNTEFTDKPICTASREYQHLKIIQLQEQKAQAQITEQEYTEAFDSVTEKACLCEDLASSAYIKNDTLKPRERAAVAICPGPNTAYFNDVYSLDEMVGHIYGRINLLEGVKRSNMFINELRLYIDYAKVEIKNSIKDLNQKKLLYFKRFREQLECGIEYYKTLIPELSNQSAEYKQAMFAELETAKRAIAEVFENVTPELVAV